MHKLTLAVCFIVMGLFSTAATEGADVGVGTPAPDFAVTTIDGKPAKLSDYTGNKKLVLVFSRAHWCPYCMKHVAQIQQSYDKIQAAGGEVLIVFREDQEGPAGLKKSKQTTSAQFPLVLDYGNKTSGSYSPFGYTTYVLDQDGVIKTILSGSKANRPTVDDILKAL